jgi:aminoglycoside 2'-N-acetyltransferase I
MVEIERFATGDAPIGRLEEVRRLLDAAFDGDFGEGDWSNTLGGRHLTAVDDGAVISHVAIVPRILDVAGVSVPTGYVEAVATAPARRGQGLATRLMEEAGRLIRGRYRLGALSTGMPGFYERLGWEVWRGPTFVQTPAGTVRSEDEDGGVMVLRFPTGAAVDLGRAIACQARHGDDW